MALCTRCGQQTEADGELCLACGGDGPGDYAVGAYSGAASRASYSPAGRYSAPTHLPHSQDAAGTNRDGVDPFWFQEPDPSQFRSPLPTAEPALGQYPAESTAASPDRRFRYARSAADPPSLPEFNRHYLGEPAGPPLSPTGRLPDPPGYAAEHDHSSWTTRPAPPGEPSGQFAWPEPDPLSDPLTGPREPDAAGLRGPESLYTPPGPDVYAGLSGPSSPYAPPEPDAYAGSGAFDYSPGLSPAGGSAATSARAAQGWRVPRDLRVNRRGQALRDLPAVPSRQQRSPRNGRWIAMAATLTVLIIAAAVVLLVGHRGTAGHTPQAGKDSKAARPSSSAAKSAPTVSGLVTIAPGAATAPHEAAVVAFLNRYFHAINRHDYGAYERLFGPALRGGLSVTKFSAGYGTTRDSAETLRSIRVIGAGQIDALVTFISHQQATDSPTNTTCTGWRISLYLIRQGGRYVLGTPPEGYQPSYHSCS